MIELAEKLLETAPSSKLTRVLLELSGTGAAEGAVKFAVESSRRPLILSFMGQYHGLSIAGVNIGSLTSDERRYWEAFQGGVMHAPYPFPYRRPKGMTESDYGDWVLGFIEDHLLKHIATPDRIAGVLFEPVACEAGIWIPPPRFARGLKRLCEAYDWLFIDDEVEAGLGRTGKMWAIEHWHVEPDLMAIGKGLSGGLMPIAAILGSEKVMGEREIAVGTTFAGHPAACVAASKTLDIMRGSRIAERSARLGARALRRVREWERFDLVGETRGLGLCIGIEIVKDKNSKLPNPEVTRRVFDYCVVNRTIPLYSHDDTVLRIEPALTIEEEVLESALDTIENSLRKFAGKK
jgi:4-aminobutyrate aminotransferase-like enzyme